MNSATSTDYGEFRRHWPMLVPSLAGITLCATHGYSLGVMIGPLEQEFGWARAQISSGMLIISLFAVIAAPMVGLAVDRFGPRRIGLTGVVFFCTGLALLSTATANILSWWGLWIFLGIGNMLMLPTVWTAAINSYFVRHRGKALATALCGTGVAAAIVPYLTNTLIEHLGWRGAYIGLGAIFVTITLPLVYFLFPAESGPADPRSSTADPNAANVSVRDGLRAPAFIKLAAAGAVFSVTICALTTNAVPVLMGQGLDRGTAAATAGLVGIGSIIGRLGGGVLLDRFNARRVAAGCVLMPLITVAILLSVPNSALAAGIACFVLGLSVGIEVDACAYLAARHFGLRAYGTLFGTINGLLLFGNGIAPLAANWVFDITRSYTITLWAQIPACVMAALLFLWMGPYPKTALAAAPAE